MSSVCPVAIIGAGPYALSASAYLGHAGVETRVFGEVMGFWHTMPRGMFLRSYRSASSIADPKGKLTLAAFEADTGRRLSTPTALDEFIDYGHWFQRQAGIEVDQRRVTRLTRDPAGDRFRLRLDDGESVEARRVVVAAGITPFAWRPPLFQDIDPARVSHSSEHVDFDAFAGQAVIVVGGGQSALESAAMLKEAGAGSVEVLVRRPRVHFLRGEKLYGSAGVVSRILYPSWGVGPPGLNWIMGRPGVFRHLPTSIAGPMAYRATRPAGAGWLRGRLDGISLTVEGHVTSVGQDESGVRLLLGDGSERVADHVVLGTGYRIDLGRYEFIDEELVRQIRLIGRSPKLSASFESSIPGLYFVGAPAAASAGPGMRFVSHTGFAAAAIAEGVSGR